MKHAVFILTVALCSWYQAGAQAHKHHEQPLHMMTLDSLGSQYSGKPYPEYNLTATTGEHCSTAADKGKIVFLNFWFDACVPCRVEFDALNRLYDSVKADTNVRFMAVTFEDTAHLPRYISYHHLRYPVASVTSAECERLNFYVGYPTSILLDKDGKIAIYETGGHLQKEKAEQFLLQQVLGRIRELERQ